MLSRSNVFIAKEFGVFGQLFAKKQTNLKKKFLQNSYSFEKIVNKISTERCFKRTKRFMVFWAIGSFLSSFLLYVHIYCKNPCTLGNLGNDYSYQHCYLSNSDCRSNSVSTLEDTMIIPIAISLSL